MDCFSSSSSHSSPDLSDWRDWSGLPSHILSDITDKLTTVDDYIRFGRVCVSWQTVIPKDFLNNIFILVSQEHGQQMSLYNHLTNRLLGFQQELPDTVDDQQEQEVPDYEYPCGSFFFKWVVTVRYPDFCTLSFRLRNPFRNCNMDDPILPLVTEGNCEIQKAVLSCDPPLDDIIMMALISQYPGLVYYKPGNQDWNSIEMCYSRYRYTHEDLIFFQRTKQFYVLIGSGEVYAVEFLEDAEPKLRQIAPALERDHDDSEMYIIEDPRSGDLLQVHRDIHRDSLGIYRLVFRIFRLDRTGQSWVEMQGIGDSVLFLSRICSILRAAPDCPGYKPNCIYYICGSISSIVYNLEDGIEEPYYAAPVQNPIIWLEPTRNK